MALFSLERENVMTDDYDYEESDDSGSALSGLESSLINAGTQIATTALQNSSIAAQPAYFQTIPVSPMPAQNSSLLMIAFIVLVGFILYKVL